MSALWVFGYGSLVWNPGFEYSQCQVGCIRGYSRRFWQGSDVHRGTKDRLGRVVTLIEDEGAVTWGRAFQFVDEESTFKYLGLRESSIGGYSSFITEFEPRDSREDPFPVLVYIALPCNSLFLGPAPTAQLAEDIAHAEGTCGHNIEYLAKLVAFMRLQVPNFWDDHLFQLEYSVRKLLSELDPQLLQLFNEAFDSLDADTEEQLKCNLKKLEATNETIAAGKSLDPTAATPQPSSLLSSSPSRYTDTVPSRKLKCIDI